MSTEAKIRLPMDMHNCFHECKVGSLHTPIVREVMVPLIEALSRKRPQWVFVSTRLGAHLPQGNIFAYSNFNIEEDGEVLGSIGFETNWRTHVVSYTMDNRNLRRKRQRSGETKAVNIKKAVKLILDNYIPLSPVERVVAATSRVKDLVGQNYHRAIRAFTSTMNNAQEDIAEMLLARPELISYLPDPTALKSLGDVWEAKKAAEEMHAAQQLNKGVTIIARGNHYIVADHRKAPSAAGSSVIVEADELDPALRQYVGMLKLVDEEDVVPGVGVRLPDNAYFVLPKEDATDG